MTILMFPKHFVILSKWNVIIFIYFIYFPCLQPISFNIKLENNICNPTDQLLYCYSDWFSLLLIRLLFPASNSVSSLICRATVFRSLICVNRVYLFFLFGSRNPDPISDITYHLPQPFSDLAFNLYLFSDVEEVTKCNRHVFICRNLVIIT